MMKNKKASKPKNGSVRNRHRNNFRDFFPDPLISKLGIPTDYRRENMLNLFGAKTEIGKSNNNPENVYSLERRRLYEMHIYEKTREVVKQKAKNCRTKILVVLQTFIKHFIKTTFECDGYSNGEFLDIMVKNYDKKINQQIIVIISIH